MDGIDAATFVSESSNSVSFTETVTDCISGDKSPNSVDITDVVDVASTSTRIRRLLLLSYRRLTSGTVDITYNVEFNAGSDTAANNTATEFVDNLSASLDDGVFNELLHEYATNNSASIELISATSSSFTYMSVYEVVSDNSSDDAKTAHSLGLAVEIVAGVLVLLAIVIVACCLLQKFYRSMHGKKYDDTLQNVTGHGASVELHDGSNRA